jgi:hypothetical protein
MGVRELYRAGRDHGGKAISWNTRAMLTNAIWWLQCNATWRSRRPNCLSRVSGDGVRLARPHAWLRGMHVPNRTRNDRLEDAKRLSNGRNAELQCQLRIQTHICSCAWDPPFQELSSFTASCFSAAVRTRRPGLWFRWTRTVASPSPTPQDLHSSVNRPNQ